MRQESASDETLKVVGVKFRDRADGVEGGRCSRASIRSRIRVLIHAVNNFTSDKQRQTMSA